MAPCDYAKHLDLAADDRARLRFLGEAAYGWLLFNEAGNAAVIFEALTLVAPEEPLGCLGLAEVALEQRDYRRAQAAAKGAERRSGIDGITLAMAFVLEARALIGLGRPEEARQAFAKAREVDPQGPAGREAAAWLDGLQRVDGIIEYELERAKRQRQSEPER